MEKKDRLRKLINYLIWKRDVPYNSALKTVAAKVGMTSSNISVAINGNEKFLTDSLMRKINRAYDSPFNESWLLSGTGEMLSENEGECMDTESIIASQQETIKKLSEALAVLAQKQI